ncbi:hypothetical protein DAEQUDRAFT_809602 [Daedalea quercina L-15889]|uniref:DUF6534 domain-containing protein n=1 Tax=Daedalea quercina L-15889 TaxID=1314783 RepID=A0A165SHL8_9APHY|nr:hypothetical protein DAEQUDRAFT_809602 [Daedalea quercina L-15889]
MSITEPWFALESPYEGIELFIIGTYGQTASWGIASALALAYLRRPKNDPWLVPSVVSFVWLLCTVCTTMNIYSAYYFTVINRHGFLTSLKSPWTLNLLTTMVSSTSTAVRLLYLSRIWRFQRKKGEWSVLLLVDILLVAVVSLLGITGAISISIFLFHPKFAGKVSLLRDTLETTVIAGICADILLVVTLCVSLYRARSGLPRTDSAITLFILYITYNGLLPTCFGIATLVALLTRPGTLLYVPFYIQIGNLFLISLVSSLNHRKTVRSQIQRELDLNYDAFNAVPDTPISTTLDHTHSSSSQASANGEMPQDAHRRISLDSATASTRFDGGFDNCSMYSARTCRQEYHKNIGTISCPLSKGDVLMRHSPYRQSTTPDSVILDSMIDIRPIDSRTSNE